MNSMEKKKDCYSNSNLEADKKARNNINLFLQPHKFHDSLLAKILETEIKTLGEQEDDEKYDFDVGEFLEQKILSQIF